MTILIVGLIILVVATVLATIEGKRGGIPYPHFMIAIFACIAIMYAYIDTQNLVEAKKLIISDNAQAERKLLDACELNLPRTQKCVIIAVPKEQQ